MTRFAVVTGTSRGLGAAIAAALLGRGWRVTGCARGAAPEALAGAQGYAHLEVDLADRDATRAAFDPARPELAPLARADRVALVHNAAVLATAPIHALELDVAVDAFAVNAAVPLWLSGLVLRGTARDADVRIVEISSGAATSPYPGWSLYCATKAALSMAGRVLAAEAREVEALSGRRISVLSYAPHVVATAMQAEIRAQDAADFPRVERFHRLHAEGGLVPPEAPAEDLAARLDAAAMAPYEAARYEPGG